MATKEEPRVVLVTQRREIWGSSFPKTKEQLLILIEEAIASIPVELRDNITYEIETASGYYEDGESPSLYIRWLRPEFEDETRNRLMTEEVTRKQRELYDKAQYELLKKKFEAK